MSTTFAGATPSVLNRARAEYLEMPGLSLTVPQAARLLGVDVNESERVLSDLVEAGLLRQNKQGAYVRGPCPRCS